MAKSLSSCSKGWAKFRKRNGGFQKLTEEFVNERKTPLIFILNGQRNELAVFEKKISVDAF